ncbi:MAG: tRNA (N6-threonylcarbamoyladenosine(37)-N6)-methyltransferase TrmO [Candidatus Thermoplasmatota archaeon]
MNLPNKKFNTIGLIISPFSEKSQCRSQGKNEVFSIELYKKFQMGLKDIEGFSHLHVLYWLHKSEKYKMIVNTPGDDCPHGLFSTRSPNRPNPIGHSIVRLLKVNRNILKVKGFDAVDGTPVLDIKPYIKSLDCKKNTRSGWIRG